MVDDDAARMNSSEYMKHRLDDQIKWYDKKSSLNKWWFIGLQVLSITAGATVPIVSLSSGDIRARFAVAVLGTIIAIAGGVVSLLKFGENWLEYRTTSESLKHEKYLFKTETEPYAGDSAYSVLVQRVEALVSQENTAWYQRLKTKKEEKKDG